MRAEKEKFMPRWGILAAFVVGALALAAVPAHAAVGQINAWTLGSNTNPNSVTVNVNVNNLAIASGSQRLFVVAVVDYTGSPDFWTTPLTATLGGNPLTTLVSTDGIKAGEHIKLFYLKEAGIPTGTPSLNVTGSNAQKVLGFHVYWATFSGVDQTSPFVSATPQYGGTSAGITFGAVINYLQFGMTFYAAGRTGTGATMSPPTGFAQRQRTSGNGQTSFTADAGVHAADGSYPATTAVGFTGGTTPNVLAVVSLRPGPDCNHLAPTVTVLAPSALSGCKSSSVTYTFRVRNNCTGTTCSSETIALSASDSDSTYFSSSLSQSSVSLAPGATSGDITLTVNIGAWATGPDTTTITATEPGGSQSGSGQTVTSVVTTGCDHTAPTITMLTPSDGTMLSGADTVKAQVFDAGGTGGITVTWQVDSGPWQGGAVPNPAYNCGPNCLVYEIALPAQAPGPHTVSVRAADSSGNTNTVTTAYTATATGIGTGTILRRTHGAQLCLDCHALQTHSSQYTSTKYGAWSSDCLTCHTPHKTTNIHLVKGTIKTPNSGSRPVTFTNTAGVADGSFGTPMASGNGVNVCEVCHTQTRNADGTPRARNDAPTDWSKHYSTNCMACHPHGNGFGAGESGGGYPCSGCHSIIWQQMQASGGAPYRHTLALDTYADDATQWPDPGTGTLAGVSASNRSCVNTCHNDHLHTLTSPATPTHENNVYMDATNQTSRAAGSKTSADKDKTDFESAQANGGMCLSCHRSPVDASHPAVDRAAYSSSAHNYTSFGGYGAWTYTMHDGSKFNRNCTKCHADRGDGRPDQPPPNAGAVHYSSYNSLLAGSTNPAGAPATFVCYNCHGNGTVGKNLSGKDVATQAAKVRNHPVNSDSVHNSVTEYANAAFGNTLGVTGRHANCQDCHEAHGARAGLSPSPGSVAGGTLNGTWGAQLSSNPAFWSDTVAGSFTKKTIVSGTDLEATLCFKCHTRYYWGTNPALVPTSPSGGFAETDVAKEFNPANAGNWGGSWTDNETAGGFHPVLATAAGNLGAVNPANLVSTNFPWSTTSRNRMTCSDCHASESPADPGGPHGSTANFLLKGPNTTWNATIASVQTGPNQYVMPAGTFCINCHSSTFANSRFSQHGTLTEHGGVPCQFCHAAVPHGGPRPGMLVASAGADGIVGGEIAGWDRATPYAGILGGLYLKSYPQTSAGTWDKDNCGCGGTDH